MATGNQIQVYTVPVGTYAKLQQEEAKEETPEIIGLRPEISFSKEVLKALRMLILAR